MKLEQFLSDQHISFERVFHRPAYTAQGLAECLHVPDKEVAKTVLLRAPRATCSRCCRRTAASTST